VFRADETAGTRRLLEEDERNPARRQFVRGREARDAAADDGYLQCLNVEC